MSTSEYQSVFNLDLLNHGLVSMVWKGKNNFDANLFNLDQNAV